MAMLTSAVVRPPMVAKFNLGDTVVCDAGISPTPGINLGVGYSPGRTFVVKEISQDGSGFIYWPADGGSGVYEFALQLYVSAEQKEETEFIDLSAL